MFRSILYFLFPDKTVDRVLGRFNKIVNELEKVEVRNRVRSQRELEKSLDLAERSGIHLNEAERAVRAKEKIRELVS